MSAPILEARRERRMVWALAGIQFTQILDFVLMMPLGPQLMRQFSISAREFGLLVSVYMFAAAASGVVASAFVDRYDRRHALLWLYGGFCMAVLGCAFATSFPMLVLTHAVAGGFGGVLGMQVYAFIGDTIPDGRRGAATGIVMSAFALASVLGVPLGLVIADAVGWRAAFIALAATVAALLVLALRALPSLRGHLRDRRGERFLATVSAVLADRNHRRAFVLVSLLMFAGFSVVPYLAPYSVHNVGVKESQLWVLWFFGGGATLFTSRWIGRQVDLRGKQRVFRAVALASIVPVLVATHLPNAPLWVAVLSSVLFMTTMSGRFVPAMALVNSAAGTGVRGTFLSLSGAVQQASAGLASLAAGLAIGHGTSGELTGYGTVGWFAVLATLGAVWVSRRVKSVS